jgi:hypothetical protein
LSPELKGRIVSFKTSKICAVLAGQVAWLAATFVLFGGMTSPEQTAPWLAVMAMFFFLPLTFIIWTALTGLGFVAARVSVNRILLYALCALAPPLTVALLAMLADTMAKAAFTAIITRAELVTFAAGSAIPGLVAGLFLGLFGAAAPVVAPAPASPVLTGLMARLGDMIRTANPPARLTPLLLPNGRASPAEFLSAGSLLLVALAALMVLNFLRVLGGPLAGIANLLLLVGQAAFLWCVLCLFANRLRGLGQSPFFALAPAALAALFVATAPPDAAEWQAPLSVLSVYVIAGAVLATFKGAAIGETDAPARSFGQRQAQPR